MRTYTPPTSVEIDVIFLVRGVVLCVYIILSVSACDDLKLIASLNDIGQ